MDHWFAEFRRHGDPRILARVFDRAAPELWRVASYLCRDRHVAEDAVQGTFLSAIEARQDWDPARPLLPWLLGLLANRVREERRRSARRPEPERVAAPRGEEDPAAAATGRELEETLRAALQRLEEPYRSTLEQHLVHGLSATEIAGRDGTAAGTVRMRLHRGLERLRLGLPKGVLAGGVGAMLLSAESMAAMRAAVLAKARTMAGVAGTGTAAGAAVAASSHGKKALLAFAALVLGALTVTLAPELWTGPTQSGAMAPAAIDRPSDRSLADRSGDSGTEADERGNHVREAVAGRPGTLRVRVLSRGGLVPVPGAKLVVFAGEAAPPSGPTPVAIASQPTGAPDRREGATDADGVATFELPAGPARIEMREPSAESAAVTVLAHETVEQVLFAWIPSQADVRVVDPAGAAVPGARIVARASSDDPKPDELLGETGGDGHWRGQLPGRALLVRALADGHASSSAVTLGASRALVTLQVGGPAGSLVGTVRGRDGRPVASACIALQPEGDGARSAVDACRVTRTDADGRYELGHVAPGSYTIYAWQGEKDERRIAQAPAVAVAAQTNVADVTFGEGARIAVELSRADGRPWVRCGFDARAEQQPARGILVGRSGLTDDHGRLQVAGLPPGRYQLQATVDQEQVRETVDLQEGQEFVFRRVIGSGAWIEVLLTDSAGAPLRDWDVQTNDVVPVSVERDALWPRQPSARTDERGIARFADVPDRPTWITICRQGSRAPLVSREVPLSTRTVFALSAAQLAQRRVSGRIGARDAGNAAAFEANLIPLPETATLFSSGIAGEVSADGSLRFDAVPPGTYGLSIFALDARGAQLCRVVWRRGIEVTGEHDVDLGTIPASTTDVAVRVLRSDGAAVGSPRLVSRLSPGHPFQACKQAMRDDRVLLQELPAGSQDVLALGDNCAPKVAQVVAPDAGRGAAIVVEPAATVTVHCEGLLLESVSGTQRVLREGRIWFEEDVRGARRPYRIGLPPGGYRVEITTSHGRWAAEFTVGTEPVEVVARSGG